jgi:predicted signal transduction protein with EAL and GGDEF domain
MPRHAETDIGMSPSLDGYQFKTVNDDHGHAVRDALLVEVACRLTELTGPNHFVSRSVATSSSSSARGATRRSCGRWPSG